MCMYRVYAKASRNIHTDVSSRARDLIFRLSLLLPPYFIYFHTLFFDMLHELIGFSLVFYQSSTMVCFYSKTCVQGLLSKRPKIGFQYKLSLNACQKYCRILQGEHSAILSTFIKLPFVIKIFVLSNFE